MKGVSQFGYKFHVEGDVSCQPFFVSCDKNVGRISCRIVSVHVFDRQTGKVAELDAR